MIDQFDIAKAVAMLTGYAARYPYEEIVDRFEVLAVELEFTAPLINPLTGAESKTYVVGGKLDVLVRERLTGDEIIIEHKTSAEDITPGSMYWQKLRIDSQCSTYLMGAKAMGYNPRRVEYDVLGKPRLKPLEANSRRAVAETPEQYGQRCADAIISDPDAFYQRGPVVRLAEEEREAALDLWQTTQSMKDHRRLGLAPKTPEACVSYSQTCPYFAVCTGETSLASAHYEDADAHEELEQSDVDTKGRLVVSNSEVRAFRRCARFHRNRYIELRRPVKTSEPLYFGSMMHRGLEAYWLGQPLEQCIDAMLTPPTPRRKAA